MKIGIITFHRAVNYGAVLQAYALQEVVAGLGAQPEIIDYRNEKIEKIYSPFSMGGNKIKALAWMLLCGGIKRRRKKKFRRFVEKYLHMSQTVYYDNESLRQSQQIYDAFITGSDQVWNTECADFDPAFFLTFVQDERKKNSYAASFGFSEIPQGFEEEYRHRLSGFCNISVRESSGRDILKNLTGRDVSVALDPTLLLSRENWAAVARDIPQKGYILLYTLLRSDEAVAYARRLSKEKGLPVVFLNERWFGNRDFTHITCASPEEFLGYFKHADYVVTNSFHGTVFSIIFNRPFVSDIHVKREGVPGKNDRSEQLLCSLGLSERILSGKIRIDDKIDWESIEKTLDGLRWKSFEYLNMIVDEKNGR